jgi:glycine/D-amino acid oxidase-like deaminating enzyme
MKLHSGLPYWYIKNQLNPHSSSLPNHIETPVAIIGSGITGALVAHVLCAAGIHCMIIDKRAPATGSTAASTSQLQYEIDIPLYQLAKKVGEANAAAAYKASLRSIADLEDLVKEANIGSDFQYVPSLYLASNKAGLAAIKREYDMRIQHQLPVTFLTATQLQEQFGIDKLGALYNEASAQMDCYQTANALLKLNIDKKLLQLFPYTDIVEYTKQPNGYLLTTHEGKTIQCEHLVIAAGFEAGLFLPEKVMQLTSTYAMVSKPIDAGYIWPKRCLIWETKVPYFYARTTADNRVMIGGEDIPYKNERLRDALLDRKSVKLVQAIHKLFPDLPFEPDMSWCGTFSTTPDGLPYIGCYPGKERMYFALGYGGNGITFSMIAAQVICNLIQGIPDERATLFGFTRDE